MKPLQFIKWSRDTIPDVEEGKSYYFKNVVSNEWNGRFEVTLNKNTVVEELDEDVEVISSPMGGAGDGQPAPMVNVVDIANAWGFWHSGQFAADYKQLFGELPSTTLKGSEII